MWLAMLLVQDPLADLVGEDEEKRAAAVVAIGDLEAAERRKLGTKLKKLADELTKEHEKAVAAALKELLAGRPDEATLKAEREEIKRVGDAIPYPQTQGGMKLAAELSEKLKDLWGRQYPDLAVVATENPKLASIEEAARLCEADATLKVIAKSREKTTIDEHRQWELLLPKHAVQVLTNNERSHLEAREDLKMKECEYRASVTINMYFVLMGSGSLNLNLALARDSREWSAHIDGGGKGGAAGVHSTAPNENMGRGGEDGEGAAWQMMTSDNAHINAMFRWGTLGIGHHGGWWTWRG